MKKVTQNIIYTCDKCGKIIDVGSYPSNIDIRLNNNDITAACREAIFCDECKIKFIKLEKEINDRKKENTRGGIK